MCKCITLISCVPVHRSPSVCEAADDASWRHRRLSTTEILQRQWERGKLPSPIFSVFGVFNHLFKIDWLHAVDQGVCPDFLGNLFHYLVKHKIEGPNELARCRVLGRKIWKVYEDNAVEDQLKEFLPKTYHSEKKSTRPPRLKGNAASCRALAPFGDLVAREYLSDEDPKEMAMKQAARHLKNCYDSLSDSNHPFSHEALRQSSKAFALQYSALHIAYGSAVLWRPMPKMHMFLELCSMGTEPAKFWNYRDEDFGGSVAKQSRMKGMWKKLSAYSKHALDLFRMKNPAPRIVD